MFKRADGIVDFDRDQCIGCKACIAACPYDAIYIDPESNSAEKCNFCTSRIDAGLEPACVVVCPTQAIIVGNMQDPTSKVSQILDSQDTAVRRPEKMTSPKLFYLGAGDHILDPQLVSIPTPTVASGMQMWAESQPGASPVPSLIDPLEGKESRDPDQSSAAALVAYNQPHRTPWDWRVSSYTWTKSIASGAFLMAAILEILGIPLGRTLDLSIGILASIFLGLTGLLLVSDLSHPARFYFVLFRPQWRSWLVLGAYLISAYALLLLAFFIAALIGWQDLLQFLRWIGLFISIPVAAYTAFLFGQAKGRDLWQNPLLSLAFLSHAVVAGSASLLLLGVVMDLPDSGFSMLLWALLIAAACLVTLALADILKPHLSPYAASAAREMSQGKYRFFFWPGVILGGIVPIGLAALTLAASPEWIGAVASVSALIGILAYEHAYIQAGQTVPQS